MAQKRTSESSREASWGPAAGLLAGCGVTLIGVAMDLPPMTILLRSMVSGCAVAVIATVFAIGWQLVTPRKEEDS